MSTNKYDMKMYACNGNYRLNFNVDCNMICLFDGEGDLVRKIKLKGSVDSIEVYPNC